MSLVASNLTRKFLFRASISLASAFAAAVLLMLMTSSWVHFYDLSPTKERYYIANEGIGTERYNYIREVLASVVDRNAIFVYGRSKDSSLQHKDIWGWSLGNRLLVDFETDCIGIYLYSSSLPFLRPTSKESLEMLQKFDDVLSVNSGADWSLAEKNCF